MRLLAERWPGLGALPRVDLGRFPTPVARLDRLSAATGAELWVKHDDLTSEVYGGNKVRKLELILGDALRRRSRSLVTVGAFGSHHVLATAVHGGRQGFQVHAVVAPQSFTDHVEEVVRADLAAGATLHPAPSMAHIAPRVGALTARLRLSGQDPYLVLHGGSAPLGTVGYVEAGLELAGQIAAGDLPEPEEIFVPFGSAGTAVGLAVGLAAAGLTTTVRGVRVVPRAVANRAVAAVLARATVRLLMRADRRFPDVTGLAVQHLQVEHGFAGDGYGMPSEEAARAIDLGARDGLLLEPTYTGRAMAALAASARPGARLLFWQTFSSADLSSLLAKAPPLPAWARP